jgi:hypothetical protein
MNEGKHYYPSLDEFKELHMTTFGKMKLSVIPEGVSMAVYNYFKACSEFPDYDKFFDYCIQQCQTIKHDLKPRYDAFYKACEKYSLDPNSTTHFPKQPHKEDIETEFWKIEKTKLTPDGIAAMYANGEIMNPFRKTMLNLGCYKNEKLFTLYIQAYPKDHKVKDYESHKSYLNALKEYT